MSPEAILYAGQPRSSISVIEWSSKTLAKIDNLTFRADSNNFE